MSGERRVCEKCSSELPAEWPDHLCEKCANEHPGYTVKKHDETREHTVHPESEGKTG